MGRIKESLTLALTLFIFLQICVKLSKPPSTFKHEEYNVPPQNKIVLGSVYCRPKNISILKDKYFEQTIVMFKSAIISAHLYNISTLEIHLFLEHVENDESYFQREVLQQMAVPGVTVNLHVYSAVDKVPQQFVDHMIYHKRFRCGYVRLYFPEVLKDVDSLIYLDSDIIITGDLRAHWKLLLEMDSDQMIAISRDSPEENTKYYKNYKNFFTSPHVSPRGVNSGLLVMNLTRMREFQMCEKLTQIYGDYSKLTDKLSNQRVLNILLYFNPGLMLLMPCNLHFMGPDCDRDAFYCKPAFEDVDGVHVIHGASRIFNKGGAFHPIFKLYNEFNVSSLNDSRLVTDLMKPIKQAYTTEKGEKCAGDLGKVLFKRFVN